MSSAGKLTELVAIEEWVETGDDGYGNVEAEWQEMSQEPAEFIHARGSETVMAARLQGRHVLIAVVRASSRTRAITADWRIRDVRTDMIYNIRDVTPRPDREWIDLLCESDPGGADDMSVDVNVLGGDKLIRKLTVIPEKSRENIRVVMAQHADEIVDMMKRLVPVDEGDLRDSIGWVWGSKVPKGAEKVADVSGTRFDPTLRITIFATDYKARWREFGVPHLPAQPFFFVSWRANRKATKNAIRAAVRKAAKTAAAGG